MEGAIGLARGLAVLLLLVVLCAACPFPETYDDSLADNFTLSNPFFQNSALYSSNHSKRDTVFPIGKRWYSVDDLQTIQKDGQLNKVKHAPWPSRQECNGGQQWVRYCSKDDHSANNLLEFLAPAIALWMPAIKYSSTKIQPDYGCQDDVRKELNYRCICGPQANGKHNSADALVISDGQPNPGNEATYIKSSWSSVGYGYTSDLAGRHQLTCGTFNVYPKPLSDYYKNDLIRIMAHELGRRFHRRTM